MCTNGSPVHIKPIDNFMPGALEDIGCDRMAGQSSGGPTLPIHRLGHLLLRDRESLNHATSCTRRLISFKAA